MKHPNRLPFEGVLTFVETPSDSPVTGSQGHCVVLTRAAAEDALTSLVGMGLNINDNWDGHDARRKVGVITDADLIGDELRVMGYVFAKDFPELEATLGRSTRRYGMSYELHDAHVKNMKAEVWVLTRVTFTGAALLLGEKAAYRKTRFRLLRGTSRVRQATEAATGIAL